MKHFAWHSLKCQFWSIFRGHMSEGGTRQESEGFMSQKEKNYVRHCFNRNCKPRNGALDYSVIFNDGKVKFEIPEKKEIKQIFGKTVRRASKWQRPSASGETPNLDDRLALADLHGTNSLLCWIDINEIGRKEIEESVISYFSAVISRVILLKGVVAFYVRFWNLCSTCQHGRLLDILINASKFIKQPDWFDLLVESNLKSDKKIEITVNLSEIWKSDAGAILGMFILKIDPELGSKLIETLEGAEMRNWYRFEEFIALLEPHDKDGNGKFKEITDKFMNLNI